MDKDTYNQRLTELRRDRDNEEENRKKDNAYYRERIRESADNPSLKMKYENEKAMCELKHKAQFERYKLEIARLKSEYAMGKIRGL